MFFLQKVGMTMFSSF